MNAIVAKEYLCFDALLEMIVADVGVSSYFSQSFFAELFGITVPIGEQISIKNVRYSENIEECGTYISVMDINDFFQKNSVPLHISFVDSNCLNEMTFGEFIMSKSKSTYIVFAFCYGVLYNEPQNNDVGHVVLLEEFNKNEDTIKVYDPGPRNSGSKIVKIDDMLYAMKRRGGVYLFDRGNI